MLARNPNNVKALFRRGRALARLKEYDRALSDLRQASQLDATDAEIRSELARVQAAAAAADQQVRDSCLCPKMYLIRSPGLQSARMFKAAFSAGEPLYDASASEPTRDKCSICGEMVDRVQMARHVIKRHSSKTKDDH